VAGDTAPDALFENPGICKPPVVFKCLPLVRSFRVIRSNYNRNILIRKNFDIFICDEARAISGIFQVGEKLGLIHHCPIVVGVHKIVGDQAFHGFGIMMQLGLVPRILERQELALVSEGIAERIAAQNEANNRA